jgi:hypothetical protein
MTDPTAPEIHLDTDARHVLLVGTGGIGSRLLQSLMTLSADALAGRRLEVICVDPSETALSLARHRVGELSAITPGIDVRYEVRLPRNLPREPELVIVATPSAVRFGVVMDLLSRMQPRNLVLEKFLFTQHGAYREVESRLEQGGIRTWVHAPRTVWPGYLDLVGRLQATEPVSMRVSGSNWALASNAIHFVPAFQLLCGEDIVDVSGAGLDPDPIENKRQGYKEVSGRLVLQGSRGSRLELVSLASGLLPLQVTIETPKARFLIEEAGERMRVQEAASSWAWSELPFRMLRASQMQEPLARILNEGRSSLPTYASMVEPHLALMRVFNTVFFGPGHETADCPVT